jgi:hypothetical protein
MATKIEYYNGIEKPVTFEKIQDNVYRINWGFNGRKYYTSIFMVEHMYSLVLEEMIDNNEFTVSELKEMISLSKLEENDAVKFLKNMISRLIKKRDNSSEVNEFYVAGIPVWLNKETRVGLSLRFASEKLMGLTTTTLWLNGMQFSFNLPDAEKILGSIEVYASKCYDNTQKLLSDIQKLNTVNELIMFDYKAGYPEKLRIN